MDAYVLAIITTFIFLLYSSFFHLPLHLHFLMVFFLFTFLYISRGPAFLFVFHLWQYFSVKAVATSSGNHAPAPPYDLCLQHKEWPSFSVDNCPQTKISPACYHLSLFCVKRNWPMFHVVFPEISINLIKIIKSFCRQLEWCWSDWLLYTVNTFSHNFIFFLKKILTTLLIIISIKISPQFQSNFSFHLSSPVIVYRPTTM